MGHADAPNVDDVPALLRQLDSPSETDRGVAERSLGVLCYGKSGSVSAWEAEKRRIRESGVVEPLLEAIRTAPPAGAAYAITALALMREHRARPGLLDALRHADEKVRRAAADGLGYLPEDRDGDGIAVRRLIDVTADDPSLDVRWAAIASLGRLGGNRAVDALLPLTRDRHWRTRWYVYHALADITDDPRALDAGRHGSVNDPKPQVRKAAKFILAAAHRRRAGW